MTTAKFTTAKIVFCLLGSIILTLIVLTDYFNHRALEKEAQQLVPYQTVVVDMVNVRCGKYHCYRGTLKVQSAEANTFYVYWNERPPKIGDAMQVWSKPGNFTAYLTKDAPTKGQGHIVWALFALIIELPLFLFFAYKSNKSN